jgi:hypothetical protein
VHQVDRRVRQRNALVEVAPEELVRQQGRLLQLVLGVVDTDPTHPVIADARRQVVEKAAVAAAHIQHGRVRPGHPADEACRDVAGNELPVEQALDGLPTPPLLAVVVRHGHGAEHMPPSRVAGSCTCRSSSALSGAVTPWLTNAQTSPVHVLGSRRRRSPRICDLEIIAHDAGSNRPTFLLRNPARRPIS